VERRSAILLRYAPEDEFQNQGMEQEQKDQKRQEFCEELVRQ
jgi:hypothetical protein